jgi:hypothetical protein
MDDITFCVMHHNSGDYCNFILERCVKSIRAIYKNNKIIVCKTITTNIDNYIINDYNLDVIQKTNDNLYVYSVIETLINIDRLNNIILMQDSMIILNKLPDDIIYKKFYYLWHFEGHKNELSYDQLVRYLNYTELDVNSKINIFKNYYNEISYKGLFGCSFGCNIDILKLIWKVININNDNLNYFSGHDKFMTAERYIPLIAHHLGVVDIFDKTYSLNGNIFQQPYNFSNETNNLTYDDIISRFGNYGYIFKTFYGRH